MIRIVQILSGDKIKKIMNIIEPEKKRKRASPVSPLDFMEEARLMWHRDPKVTRSEKSEDRDFREHFGCGVNVAHTIWMMMESRELIPNDGDSSSPFDVDVLEELYQRKNNVYPCWNSGS